MHRSKIPIVAGIHPIVPWLSAISIDGIIKDQTDAAIITPAANPKKTFWTFVLTFFLKIKTTAAPKCSTYKWYKYSNYTFHIFIHFVYQSFL